MYLNSPNLNHGLVQDPSCKWSMALDEQEFFKYSSHVCEFLREEASDMTEVLECFSQYNCYFAESAYGHPAAQDNDMNPVPPMPYHIQLPLLWTLALHDYIPIKYMVLIYDPLPKWLGWFDSRLENGRDGGEKFGFMSQLGEAAQNNLLRAGAEYKRHTVKKGGR